MPRTLKLLPAIAALALLGACASEGVTANEPVKVVETVEASATVQTVDPVTRQILLTDNASGESFVVTAGEEVKNFAQIESGDQVRVAYSLGRAARMATPGQAGVTTTAVVGTAEPGARPGIAIGEVTTMVLEFVAYNAGTTQATIIDPEGVQRTVTVESPEGQEFASRLKKGDKVEVTFTEALAIVVEEQ
jgi:translation elongation factor P/translation initiation factor 5A